jgi:SET domain-containing protein
MSAKREPEAPDTVIHPGDLYVAPSSVHGMGVFAAREFRRGEVIEVCPVLRVKPTEVKWLDKTSLCNHYFEWPDGGGALAMGYGSLYNHSWAATARAEHDFESETLTYTAVRKIKRGEEITINYTGEPNGRGELRFDAGPPPAKTPVVRGRPRRS